MDDALSFLIEAEAFGLLTDTPPRVVLSTVKADGLVSYEKPAPRRGKRAAKAKREKAKS